MGSLQRGDPPRPSTSHPNLPRLTSGAWILLSRWNWLLRFLQRLPQVEHRDVVGDLGRGRRRQRGVYWNKNDSSPTVRSPTAQTPLPHHPYALQRAPLPSGCR